MIHSPIRIRRSLFLLFAILFIFPQVIWAQSYDGEAASSKIEFATAADTIYLYLNRNFDELIKLTDEKAITVAPSNHTLFVFGRNFPEEVYPVSVDSGQTVRIRLPELSKPESIPVEKLAAYKRVIWNANLVIEPRPGTTVHINNEPARTGLIAKTVPPGNHLITYYSRSGKKSTAFVPVQRHRLSFVSQYPLRSDIDRFKYTLPGQVQYYRGERLKGSLMMGGTAFFTVASVTNYILAHSARKDFDGLRIRYHNITWDEQEALEMGNRLDELRGTVNNRRKRGNLFLLATALLYSINLLDVNSEPKNGYSKVNLLNPENNLNLDLNEQSASLSLRFNF